MNVAGVYGIKNQRAADVVEEVVEGVRTHWDSVATEAALSDTDHDALWRRAVLNPFALEQPRQ